MTIWRLQPLNRCAARWGTPVSALVQRVTESQRDSLSGLSQSCGRLPTASTISNNFLSRANLDQELIHLIGDLSSPVSCAMSIGGLLPSDKADTVECLGISTTCRGSQLRVALRNVDDLTLS